MRVENILDSQYQDHDTCLEFVRDISYVLDKYRPVYDPQIEDVYDEKWDCYDKVADPATPGRES